MKYDDTISGFRAQRPGLDQAIGMLREDDILVVWKLDRLGRGVKRQVNDSKIESDRKLLANGAPTREVAREPRRLSADPLPMDSGILKHLGPHARCQNPASIVS